MHVYRVEIWFILSGARSHITAQNSPSTLLKARVILRVAHVKKNAISLSKLFFKKFHKRPFRPFFKNLLTVQFILAKQGRYKMTGMLETYIRPTKKVDKYLDSFWSASSKNKADPCLLFINHDAREFVTLTDWKPIFSDFSEERDKSS